MKSEKIVALNNDKEVIRYLLEKGKLTEAKKKLDLFKLKNESYYTLLANYYYLNEEYSKGIELLESALKEFPFSFEILYNLASLKSAVFEYVESLWLFARCIKVADSDENREEATTQLNQIIMILKESSTLSSIEFRSVISATEQILKEGDERTYPLNRFNESLVKSIVKDSSDNEYFTEMYKSNGISDVDANTRYFFKTEMLQGVKTESFCFEINNETTLPIGLFEQYDDITVTGPKEDYHFPKNVLNPNQINYFTFFDAGKYRVTSKNPFFAGKPINMEPPVNSAQLIVTIFVDGLSNNVIENRLQELMPQTYNFFSKGYINNNCYTTGDWTLPSIASIFTGKTTINHGLFHPTNHFELNKNNYLFPKYFKESGYMTTQIHNDWRITPTYGYLEGMDRILYQNYVGGFTAGEVIIEAIEHLETFKKNNHFLWIGLPDLHDVADEKNNDLMSQVRVSAKYRQNKSLGTTSVLTAYDPNKIKKYEAELKRIDLHLSTLYNYLNSNFNKENFIVALISDHGQTYLEQENFLLHEHRRKVPFMLAGGKIEPKYSNELCSTIDIFPTIGSIAGVEMNNQEGVVLKDFVGNGRDNAITETIHPNQPYLVAITDNHHIFRFKTKQNVSGNGTVDMEEFEAQLIDIKTNKDVSEEYAEKLKEYCNMVILRAMKMQP